MNIDLSGRTALVTGSTAGIGQAIATGLARAGATVIVNGRSEERTRAAAEQVARDAGVDASKVRAAAADVGSAEGCAELTRAEPDIDVLVANTGIFKPHPVFEIPDDEWLQVFEVNVLHAVRLSRHYVPRMIERGWGRSIFVSSESALQITPEMVQYAMSKTAMLAVQRGIAESFPASGVTFNTIMPGPTLTDGVREMLGGGTDAEIEEKGRAFVEEERSSSLLKRLIDPEEVANLAVYLASEQASATTGAALRVDGGVLRAAIG